LIQNISLPLGAEEDSDLASSLKLIFRKVVPYVQWASTPSSIYLTPHKWDVVAKLTCLSVHFLNMGA